MCYSWHEDVGKTVQNETAKEKPRTSAPQAHEENRVRLERSRFWTTRIGRRDRATEEATPDRTLEKV
jgi:hypothetical protein